MDKKVIVQFCNEKKGKVVDLEIPLDISANELITALNSGFKLGINLNDETKCHMVSENPIGLLMGEQTLEQLGINDGSRIIYKGR